MNNDLKLNNISGASKKATIETDGSLGTTPDSVEIPSSWVLTPLEDVAHIGTGTTPSRGEDAYWNNGSIPWVMSSAVNELHITKGSEFVTPTALKKTSLKLYPRHTLLIALYGEGKTRGKVSELLIDATINQALAAIQLNDESEQCRDFVKWFLHSNYQVMRSRAAGGNQPNLNLGIVKALQVPIPPINEQTRIVSTIESLQARSARTRALLAEVKPLVAQLRQGVLRNAFNGSLTADWRAKQRETVTNSETKHETTSELLKRICVGRRERWETAQLAGFESKGKEPNKGWRVKYKEPEAVDQSELPKLPERWCWVRGEQLFEWSSGKNLPKTKMRNGNIPVFGGNGCSGNHDEANVSETTICIGRVGAHCGNVHLTPGPTWITDNAIYATLVAPSITHKFATFALRSLNLNERSRGGGQPYVNQDVLNDALLPLPPVDEQEIIVEKLYASRRFTDSNLLSIASTNVLLNQLDQSILSKAFRGELVPQDPSDEPASELLARIRATRIAASTKKKPSKKKASSNKKTKTRAAR